MHETLAFKNIPRFLDCEKEVIFGQLRSESEYSTTVLLIVRGVDQLAMTPYQKSQLFRIFLWLPSQGYQAPEDT